MGREDKATWKANYFTKLIVSFYFKNMSGHVNENKIQLLIFC